MQSVSRAFRALVRMRRHDIERRDLTLLPALDPPVEVAPVEEPPLERAVEIPLYLEP